MADKDTNKDNQTEYEQYSQSSSGRLFSSAMFGFNKEEVLEYLEEMADENFQRQEAAEMQMQELRRQIIELEQELEDKSNDEQVPSQLLEEKEDAIKDLRRDLDIARAATQQAEGELLGVKQSQQALKQENAWLRQETAKSDNQIASLHKQLEEITEGQWDSAQEEINELRKQLEEVSKENENVTELETENEDLRSQLEEALERIEWLEENPPEQEEYEAEESTERVAAVSEKQDSVKRTAAEIINEAYLEADRIRNEATSEKQRLQRQMQNSTGDLAESINNLRTEISGMEGDVGDILELVQAVLADVLNSLGRAEQNLTTFGNQINRFPAASPPVPKPQVLYFQPNHTARISAQDANESYRKEQISQGSLRRILPSGTTTGSATAIKTSFMPTYTAQAAPTQEYEDVNESQNGERREQLRGLADNLVDTLIQMLDTKE